MAASVTDKFKKVKGFFSTTLASQKNSGAGTMSLSDATDVPTDTGLVFTVGRVDSSGTATPAARAIYKGTLSGTTVSNLTLVEGTDQTHAAGTVVEITWTQTHWNDAVDGLLVSLDQDGTLKAGAVDNAAVLASDVVTTAKILDSNVTTAKIADGAVTAAKIGIIPAFRATTTAAAHTTLALATITSWTEEYDTSSNFASGIFTAPIAGLYSVQLLLRVTDLNARMEASVILNGSSTVGYGFSAGTSANHDPTALVSTTVSLAVNDTLEAKGGTDGVAKNYISPSSFSVTYLGKAS